MGEIVDLNRAQSSDSAERLHYAETLRNIGAMLKRRISIRARRSDVIISFKTEAEADTLRALVETIRKSR